jgi:hypothetical protein
VDNALSMTSEEDLQVYRTYTFPDIFVRREGVDGTFYGNSWMNDTPSRNGRIYPRHEILRAFRLATRKTMPLFVTKQYGEGAAVELSDVIGMIDSFEFHGEMLRIKGKLFDNALARSVAHKFDRCRLVPSGLGNISHNVVSDYDLKYLSILQENPNGNE